jgi:hypothetical protein
VRYIGEGHTIESPLNILDFWQRVYAWYDDFLDISLNEKGNFLWDGNTHKSRAHSGTIGR